MDKTSKVIVGVIVLILVIWGIVALARKGSQNTQTPANTTAGASEPIKLGFVGPLSGDAAAIGTVAKAAVEVAVDEINKDGKMGPVTVVYEDSQCNAKAATEATNKLMNVDKVTAIIGGLCSTETAAFGPTAMQNRVIVMSYGSSAPNLSNLGKYFFRDYPSDAFQGKFAAEYAYNKLGARKVAVLYHTSDYGTGIKNVFVSRFKELGGEVVAEEGAPQESRDYRTQLSKIKSLNPDLLYTPTYPEGATVLIQQARDLGLTTRMLAADAWDDTKLQKDASGKGDLYYTAAKTGFSDEFKSKVLAKTGGSQVSIGSSQAYDAAKILTQTIRNVGTDPDKIADALRSLVYDGVSGHIDFDDHGDLTEANYVVKQFKDGAAVEVQ